MDNEVRSGMTGAFDGGGATDLINRNSPLFDHQIRHLQGRIFQCHPRPTDFRQDSHLVDLRVCNLLDDGGCKVKEQEA